MKDTALYKYEIIQDALLAENKLFWTRSNFFMVANTGLLGFLANGLAEILSGKTSSDALFIFWLLSVVGFVSVFLWNLSIEANRQWMQRWQCKIINLEPAAFGELHIRRGVARGFSTVKFIAKTSVFMFFIAYLLIILYCQYSACLQNIEHQKVITAFTVFLLLVVLPVGFAIQKCALEPGREQLKEECAEFTSE